MESFHFTVSYNTTKEFSKVLGMTHFSWKCLKNKAQKLFMNYLPLKRLERPDCRLLTWRCQMKRKTIQSILLHIGYIFIGLDYTLSWITILRCQEKYRFNTYLRDITVDHYATQKIGHNFKITRWKLKI